MNNKHEGLITEFLKESNKIEGVFDDTSLKQAERAWEYLMEEDKMTANVILRTHKILMFYTDLYENEKGQFRNIMVYIGGEPAVNALLIQEKIEQLVKNINDVVQNGQNQGDIFLKRISKEQHVVFEHIHPFVDGNGRVGRLLLNWTRLKVDQPLLIIKASERDEYYKWFKTKTVA